MLSHTRSYLYEEDTYFVGNLNRPVSRAVAWVRFPGRQMRLRAIALARLRCDDFDYVLH